MRVTKSLFTSVAPAALMALAITPALAQSTGTQDVETVVVTGVRANLNGLMNATPIAKERSTISKEFLETQIAGQTVFQSLNFMPGVNFTNNDPYGSTGGTIRLHGQDGSHIALTLDGMPLNDTGNYAIYTNQMPDAEGVERISVNQGTTDVDTPTAAAMGGVIAIQSDMPHDDFNALGSLSLGQFAKQRYLVRVDSGKFGPWDTKAYAMLSYQDYDKFKGPGKLKKIQGNFNVYQDVGDLGWFSFAGHWNVNRNNSTYGMQWAPNTTGFTSSLNGKIDLISNGDSYIANPGSTNTLDGTGWDRDYQAACAYAAPKVGTADKTMTGCSNWYKGKVNPSDTGNLRFHSLWHITSDLTFTADASLQYVLANGGGIYSFYENAQQLIGSSAGGTETTTSKYGCIAGKGCDLNGDGDVMDQVAAYQPSTTNTRRWGYSSSLIYKLTDDHTLQLAYTLDYGLHRQTGTTTFLNVDTTNNVAVGIFNPFGGVTDKDHLIKDATGTPLRYRDRKSKAILNQLSFDYEGKWFGDVLQSSIGFRLPFFERDLNQYCYEQAGTSTAYCTTQPTEQGGTNTLADGTVTFAKVGSYQTVNGVPNTWVPTQYVPGGAGTVRYNKFLPHVGLTLLPWGPENQFFASYAQEMAAPKTDNLYKSGKNAGSSVYTPFIATKPETSTTYMLGYRYLGEDLQASVILWNTQIRNRIVSSYDQDAKVYFDHTIGGANTDGIDVEANYKVTEDLSLYANASYDHSRITKDVDIQGYYPGYLVNGIQVQGFAPTAGKELTDTPPWMFSGRVNYNVTSWFRVGADGKYVARRFATEDDAFRFPDYWTAGLDATVNLDGIGATGSYIKFNVDNLFDKHYFSSINSQTCWAPKTTATGSCSSIPYAYIGAPRTFQVTLVAVY